MKLYQLFLFIFVVACGSKQPVYKPQELTTASILKARLGYLDEQFSTQDLCDDFRLMKSLVYYIQNDATPQVSLDSGCPADFLEFVTMTQGAIASLRDLHTQVLFGNGLDAVKLPVVVSCTGDDACASLIGSPLYPISASVETKIYGAAFS